MTYQERYKQVEEIVKSSKEQYDILDKAIGDLNGNDRYNNWIFNSHNFGFHSNQVPPITFI